MADSYYGGAGAGGGGNEWELVLLTASTYAAAPGPVPVPVPVPVLPLNDARNKTEQLTPPAAAIFMSQHFNLPAATGSCADLNLNGGRQQQQLTPAMPMLDDEAVDPESETEQDDGLTLTSSDDVLIADADIALLPSEERQTNPLIGCYHAPPPGFDTCLQPDAAASSDHHHIRSTSPSHHNVPAAHNVPSEAHAWWNKTFRFLRNNSRESLTFRFITIVGLAVLGQRDKLQLKLEFNVDTHEKISCAVREEPLGQVKLNMLVGGRPVALG